MPLKHLNNDDRWALRKYLDEYAEHPYAPILGKTLDRTRDWAFGMTMKQIADQEGVSTSTVSKSIISLAYHVLEYATRKES